MVNSDVKDRYLSVNGIQIHILEAGSPEKPLIIFLHGFPEPSSMWRPYLEALKTHYHVVAPDMRGYSPSSLPSRKENYKISTLVQDIRGLVNALGHQTSFLIAHDWGGLIAWHCLAHHPEIFRRGIIVNAPHPKIYAKLYQEDPDQKRRSAYVRLFLLPFSHKILAFQDYRLLRNGVFDIAKKPFSEQEKDEYLSLWRKSLREQLLYYKANIVKIDGEFSDVGSIDVPVLVLWGMRDANLSRNNLVGLGQWVKNLTVKQYSESSHWLPQEKPKELVKDMSDFLNREN